MNFFVSLDPCQFFCNLVTSQPASLQIFLAKAPVELLCSFPCSASHRLSRLLSLGGGSVAALLGHRWRVQAGGSLSCPPLSFGFPVCKVELHCSSREDNTVVHVRHLVENMWSVAVSSSFLSLGHWKFYSRKQLRGVFFSLQKLQLSHNTPVNTAGTDSKVIRKVHSFKSIYWSLVTYYAISPSYLYTYIYSCSSLTR